MVYSCFVNGQPAPAPLRIFVSSLVERNNKAASIVDDNARTLCVSASLQKEKESLPPLCFYKQSMNKRNGKRNELSSPKVRSSPLRRGSQRSASFPFSEISRTTADKLIENRWDSMSLLSASLADRDLAPLQRRRSFDDSFDFSQLLEEEEDVLTDILDKTTLTSVMECVGCEKDMEPRQPRRRRSLGSSNSSLVDILNQALDVVSLKG